MKVITVKIVLIQQVEFEEGGGIEERGGRIRRKGRECLETLLILSLNSIFNLNIICIHFIEEKVF